VVSENYVSLPKFSYKCSFPPSHFYYPQQSYAASNNIQISEMFPGIKQSKHPTPGNVTQHKSLHCRHHRRTAKH